MATPKEIKLPFGKTAILLGYITESQLQQALHAQINTHKNRQLGEILVEKKILTQAQVQTVLLRQLAKTMICPQCHRKYQIVAFQEGRVYTCRDCPTKPILISETKNTKATGKKVDLMGLTQEMALFPKNKIDFAEEETPTTSKIVQKVGLAPFLADYSKRPRARHKFNYIGWGMIVSIVGLVCWIALPYILATSEEKKTHQPHENSDNTPKEPIVISPMIEESYKKIRNTTLDAWNYAEVDNKLAQCRQFLNNYPSSMYQAQVEKEKEWLENQLRLIHDRSMLEKELAQIPVHIQHKNFDVAEKILDKTIPRSQELNLGSYVQESQEKLFVATKEHLEEVFLNVPILTNDYKFAEAVQLIETSMHTQIRQNQEALEKLLEKTREGQAYYDWLVVAENVMQGIYPMLQKQNYTNAITHLQDISKQHPLQRMYFPMWISQLQKVNDVAMKIERAILPENKPVISWNLHDKTLVEGTIIKYNQKTKMIYVTGAKGLRNFLLNQVESKEFIHICYPSAKDIGMEFTVFLLSWRGMEDGLWLPQATTSEGDMMVLYFLAEIYAACDSQNPLRCHAVLKNMIGYSGTKAYKIFYPKAIGKIWDTARYTKAGKRIQRDFFLAIKQYCPESTLMPQVLEYLKKLK